MPLERPPTIKEIDSLIDRNKKIIARWPGLPDFLRNLEIEIAALEMLRNSLAFSRNPYGDGDPEEIDGT